MKQFTVYSPEERDGYRFVGFLFALAIPRPDHWLLEIYGDDQTDDLQLVESGSPKCWAMAVRQVRSAARMWRVMLFDDRRFGADGRRVWYGLNLAK